MPRNADTHPYVVGKNRRFASFEAAERYLRRYVAENPASVMFPWSIRLHDNTVACVSMDGCGRVWTDISGDAAMLIPASGPCVWDRGRE